MRVFIGCMSLFLAAGQGAAQEQEIVGFLQPYRSIELTFPESGILSELLVKDGQKVSRGMRLASLDNRVLDAAIAVAKARSTSKAAISMARITFEDKQARLHNIKRLYADGNAHQDEVFNAQVETDLADARWQEAREQQQIAQLEYQRILAQRERRWLTSPIDGRVAKVNRDIGEAVNPSEGAVIQLVQLNVLKLVVHIDELSSKNIKPGDRFTAWIGSHPEPVSLAAEKVAVLIDPSSGTVETHLLLDNRSSRFNSGQRVRLQLGG